MAEGWNGEERRARGVTADDLAALASTVDDLATEAAALRKTVRSQRRKLRGVALVVAGFAILFLMQRDSQRDLTQEVGIRTDQNLGLIVALCAMQNVVRLEVSNHLTDGLNREVFEGGNGEAWLSEGRKRFGMTVECESFVPKDRPEVRIELRYPPTIPLDDPSLGG